MSKAEELYNKQVEAHKKTGDKINAQAIMLKYEESFGAYKKVFK